MRIVVQRVSEASCTVDGKITGAIKKGLLLLVAFHINDTASSLPYMVNKVLNLRIFEDDQQKMNKSILDVKGEILSISQFTLYGDAKKGNRPSFTKSATFSVAEPLYDKFNELLAALINVRTGVYGADMKISLVNDGPVTIILDDNCEQNVN